MAPRVHAPAGGTGRAADKRTAAAPPTSAPAAAQSDDGRPAPADAKRGGRRAADDGRGGRPAEGLDYDRPASEPDTILPKDATTDNVMFMMANVYSALTYRQFDQLGQPPKIVPHLAESFERKD